MTLAGHRWPATRLIPPPADEPVLVHGLLRALAAFRWFAWVWMSIVATIDLHNGVVAHPTALVGFGATALALTAAITVVVRVAPADALRWPLLLVELVLGAAMVGLDPWVYGPGVDHAQSLGSVWPLAAVLAVGVRAGGRAGVVAGLVIGVSRGLGEAVVVGGDWDGDRVLGVFGSMVLYGLGGGAAGLTAVRLREARREISLARAREEVARTLHDGVLQTLAVVQRRSDDTELVQLAREQEVELRAFLFGAAVGSGSRGGDRARRVLGFADASAAPDLVAALRHVAARAERQHGCRVEVAAGPDVPALSVDVLDALAGAVTEALANAGKHAGAQRVTVYVDLDDDPPGGAPGIVCTVKDDGCGFDPATLVEGEGLRRSVRDRLAEVGGVVELHGRPGRGADVVLRAPATARRREGR